MVEELRQSKRIRPKVSTIAVPDRNTLSTIAVNHCSLTVRVKASSKRVSCALQADVFVCLSVF